MYTLSTPCHNLELRVTWSWLPLFSLHPVPLIAVARHQTQDSTHCGDHFKVFQANCQHRCWRTNSQLSILFAYQPPRLLISCYICLLICKVIVPLFPQTLSHLSSSLPQSRSFGGSLFSKLNFIWRGLLRMKGQFAMRGILTSFCICI